MTPQEFIVALAPAARACMAHTGIPASFTVAQGALESGWGRSDLARQAMNLFGVKADSGWHGPVFEMETREVIGGKSVIVMAKWRKYATWQECIDDRANFFLVNPRYRPAFQFKDGRRFASAVAAAGYATDPAYSALLISIIDGRSLAALDVA